MTNLADFSGARDQIVSDSTRPAFGLWCRGASRTGDTHRAAFVFSMVPGYMFVITEDCTGGFINHVTISEARERYARIRKVWDGVPAEPHTDFVALDYCRRYVTSRANWKAAA